MQQYIRLDEAIRKYGKTRQTFYNYINKGILEVKKINNRLFLDTHAIENLMKTIIDNEIDGSDTEEVQTAMHQGVLQDQLQVIEELLDTTLMTRIESLQQQLGNHISQVKQEILHDLKNILGVQINHLMTTQNTQLLKVEHLEDKIRTLHQGMHQWNIFSKKLSFYGVVLGILIIHYIISILL